MTDATHMRREILEIPDAVRRLHAEAGADLARAGARLAEADPRFLVTVARGSSDHAASFIKYAVELTAGVPVASLGPSIASVYGAPMRLAGGAAIAISQSGKSPDIVAMAETARNGGALTIALTNTAGSPLAAASDHSIDIAAGPERSVAATKSFVNSAVAGLALLAAWKKDAGLADALGRLPDALEAAIDCDWSPLADRLAPAAAEGRSLFILGRGPSIALAHEAALKLKETCSVHAEAYSAAEVMHGPLALVGPGFPVLTLAARDAAESVVAAATDRLAQTGAAAFITSRLAEKAMRLPHATTGHPLTDPLTLIVSFYVFVEAFARRLGLDPDRPPNLRKVTETI